MEPAPALGSSISRVNLVPGDVGQIGSGGFCEGCFFSLLLSVFVWFYFFLLKVGSSSIGVDPNCLLCLESYVELE